MDRRSFLRYSLPASAVIGAGCVSSNDEGTPESTSDGSPADGDRNALEVVEDELIHAGSGEDAEVKVRATVENVGAEPLGQVVASATFVEGETLLGSWIVTANGITPDQRWVFEIRSGDTTGEDTGAVDGVQLDLEERVPAAEYGSSNIEILEDELAREENDVAVDGVAKNVGEQRLEYATVVATFVDGDDLLVGPALTHTVRNVDPDQRFAYRMRYTSQVRDTASIEGYQLSATDRIEDESG